MRIAVVNSYYPSFLRQAYADDPGLGSLPYEEQHRALMSQMFARSDAHERGLGEQGVPAVDLILNCDPLQRQWLREHGGKLRLRRATARTLSRVPHPSVDSVNRRVLQLKTIAAQVEHYEADVVLIQPVAAWTVGELRSLRRRGHLVVGQIASAAPPEPLLREYDLILSSFPHYVERFRSLGIDSEYLRHFFYSRAMDVVADGEPAPTTGRDIDTAFVGGVHARTHRRGTEMLEELCRRVRVDVWGYGADTLPEDSAIRRAFHGQLWGRDMYRVLARTRIALNRHIDEAEGYANNMRMFEATGMGALLMTEEAPNLSDHFEPGVEVVTYRDVGELADRIHHYLENEAERSRIAAAGQRRTLREHSERQRMRELIEILAPRLADRPRV